MAIGFLLCGYLFEQVAAFFAYIEPFKLLASGKRFKLLAYHAGLPSGSLLYLWHTRFSVHDLLINRTNIHEKPCLYCSLKSVHICVILDTVEQNASKKEVPIMPMNYKKLFALMKEKGLTTYRIRKENIISQSALTSLNAGKSVTTDTIAALCKALGCQPGDIMEYVPDGESEARQ